MRSFKSSSAAHIHKHLDDVICDTKEFGLIGSSIDDIINPNSPSAFLIDSEYEGVLGYSTEADVESHVYLYVKDLVRALSLIDEIQIRRGIEIVRLKQEDLWLLTVKGVPILAIEVKTPTSGILENRKVISQITQYMKFYRNFGGLCQVFGITDIYRVEDLMVIRL